MNDLHNAFNKSLLNFCLRGGLGHKDKTTDKDHRYPFRMGVELELERVRKIPDEGIKGWTTHIDDSLRNGIEFVTDGPMSGNSILAAVHNFYQANMTYDGGPRTSTHIHVNMGYDTVETLRVMFILSYCLEDALFQMLTAKRKYCGYCMPLSEMPAWRIRNFLSVTEAAAMLQTMGGNNADKYYGFNINSVRKHGTVEFRYFPGAPSKDELVAWMDYCTQIKRAGQSITIEGLLEFSDSERFAAWICKMFPEWGRRLVAKVGADSIFTSLQDVLGMLPADQPQREESIVFVGPVLLQLVNKLELSDDTQFAWFKEQAEGIKIMTTGEWGQLLNKARRLNSKAAAKKQPEIQYDVAAVARDWDLVANPAPEQPYAQDQNDINRRYLEIVRREAERQAALVGQVRNVEQPARPALRPRGRVNLDNPIPPARNPRGGF